MNNSMVIPQKLKLEFYFWAYTPKIWKEDLEEYLYSHSRKNIY